MAATHFSGIHLISLMLHVLRLIVRIVCFSAYLHMLFDVVPHRNEGVTQYAPTVIDVVDTCGFCTHIDTYDIFLSYKLLKG